MEAEAGPVGKDPGRDPCPAGTLGNVSVTACGRLGGPERVRSIVAAFVDRVFDDMMIGFHFRAADRAHVKEREAELALRFLGEPVAYRGRPLSEAHAPHPITGGQFHRRLVLLRETLEEHGVPGDLVEAWIAHDQALRGQVTREPGSACLHLPAPGRDPEGG